MPVKIKVIRMLIVYKNLLSVITDVRLNCYKLMLINNNSRLSICFVNELYTLPYGRLNVLMEC